MPLVELCVEDPRWNGLELATLAETAATATLRHLNLPEDHFSISAMGCNAARISALNADFRGKPIPTNVLSWPSEDRAAEIIGAHPDRPEGCADDPAELGDIAICYDTCLQEATDQGKTPSDHVTHLIVHATLHLLGYDHIEDEDAALMEALETEILAKLGIADPYLCDV